MKNNKTLLLCLQYAVFYFDTAFAQVKETAVGDTTNKNRGNDFKQVQIKSSVDHAM